MSLSKSYPSLFGQLFSIKVFLIWIMVFNFIEADANATKKVPNKSSKPKKTKHQDSVIFQVDTFFLRLDKYSKKKRLINLLVSPFIVEPEKKVEEKILPSKSKKIQKNICPDSTKFISKVKIIVFEPFGATINNLDRKPTNWLERTGNNLHHRTREWVIIQKLLIKKGDKYDKFKIAESERLIRQTGYVNDAKIVIINNDFDCDSFDVLVYVFDLFTLNISGSADFGGPSGDISFYDNNFLGYGQNLNFSQRIQLSHHSTIGRFTGNYLIPQIGNSFVSAQIFHRSDLVNESFGFNFNRPMITYSIIYGGGIGMRWDQQYYSVKKTDTSFVNGNFFLQTSDAWISRAFEPKKWEYLKQKGIVKQISLGQRVINNRYLIGQQNQTEIIKSNLFRNNTLFLSSINLNKRSYYKDQYIFGFGKTEDISLGNVYSLTGGYEFGTLYNRQYLGVKYGFATLVSNLGYFYFGSELGSFIKYGKWDQGALRLSSLYISNIYKIEKFKLRQFGWIRYINGLNRQSNEFITLNNYSGIRGANTSRIGNEIVSLNLESDVYLPYNILGFKLTGLLLMDFSLLKPTQKKLINSPLYQGFGLGVRFKNEHLIFDAIELSFLIYPNHQQLGVSTIAISSSSNSYYKFSGFDNYQPSTVSYGY